MHNDIEVGDTFQIVAQDSWAKNFDGEVHVAISVFPSALGMAVGFETNAMGNMWEGVYMRNVVRINGCIMENGDDTNTRVVTNRRAKEL